MVAEFLSATIRMVALSISAHAVAACATTHPRSAPVKSASKARARLRRGALLSAS
jgi:hypothetical protein